MSQSEPLLDSQMSKAKRVDGKIAERTAWGNIAAFVCNIVLIYASSVGLLGPSNEEISNKYTTLVTPPPYAFAIWGVIFTSEAALIVWQALPAQRGSPAVVKGVGPWFAAANVIQSVWSVLFARELFAAASLALVGIAATLAMAARGLTPYKAKASPAENAFLHFPIGLHGGWTCAAALVNINLLLVASGVSTSWQVTAAILSVFFACGAGLAGAFILQDPMYLAGIAWALGTISQKTGLAQEYLGPEGGSGFSRAVGFIAVLLVAAEVGRSAFRARA